MDRHKNITLDGCINWWTDRYIIIRWLSLIVGTILSYGQTGTSKTYTMAGENVPETRDII